MKIYSENISPDSLTGSIFAVEGIKDGCVILNGPTGCKFYHSAISDNQFIRSMSFDATEYSEEFYFGQPRVPCTYLDGDDYVYGSSHKLDRILESISDKDYKFVAIINSPGAALIGDDLNAFLDKNLVNTPFISVENTGYSNTFASGFESTICKLIDKLDFNQKYKGPGNNKKKVNLLGLSIYQKYFDENYKEIKKILSYYDIHVISAIGAGDSIEEIKNIPFADLNIVLFPEYGRSIGEKLESKFKTPFIVLEEGPPVGFLSTESLIEEVCNFLDIDKELGIEDLERARARAYLYIARFSSLTGLPKGATFSIKAESSLAYSLTKFLTKYLGMSPVAIEYLEDSDKEFENKLESYLRSINSEEVLCSNLLEEDADILFSDGNTIAQYKFKGKVFAGIEVGLPSLGYIDVLPKSLFGASGSLHLIEQVLNGLRYI